MAGVTFSKKRLDALLGRKLSPEQWDERASLLGIGFEGIQGDDISFEVYPNRPDLLSDAGLARALRGFLGIGKPRMYPVKKSSYQVIVDSSVAKVRPFTACAVVTNIRFTDASLKDLIQFQEKLHTTYCRNRKKAAIGVYPLDGITWPVSYLARRPDQISFQPLDAHKALSARQILEQHPAGKAYGHLLKDADKYPLFIDAAGHVLSMPPIINSEHTGRVTTRTASVFIECSGFDLRVVQQLIAIIAASISDQGGVIHQVAVCNGHKKVATPVLDPVAHAFDVGYANRTLGTGYSAPQASRLLERMGHQTKGMQVLVPAYRIDVLHARDLVEDLAIAAGYDTIQPAIPHVAAIAHEDPLHTFQRRVADLLAGLGLLETNTFHLTSVERQTTLMQSTGSVVELANSLNADYNALRSWMLPSLMDVLRLNKHHDYPQRFFGIGAAFSADRQSETGVKERMKLAIVTSHPRADYTEIRQLLEYMLDRLEVKARFVESEHPSVIPGRAAEALVGMIPVAMVGELHPKVLRSWDLEQPVAGIELDLEALFTLLRK
ncbi:phenylalanine--tRNA ligase subunit beta [Candidatus Woesearchaeota archaeon]|nr:phenylalanine--tRNA ligase subunit beta [Candidatus Woesearchaeota archaeon]